MTEELRLASLIDFFNRRTDGTLFFPDVYYPLKFCAYIAGGALRQFEEILFAFFIQDIGELRNPDRLFPVSPDDIARINPNSRTAPIFRSRRDLQLTKTLYADRPVLVDRSADPAVSLWPVRYVRMLDMANDASHFLDPQPCRKQEHIRSVETYGRRARPSSCPYTKEKWSRRSITARRIFSLPTAICFGRGKAVI